MAPSASREFTEEYCGQRVCGRGRVTRRVQGTTRKELGRRIQAKYHSFTQNIWILLKSSWFLFRQSFTPGLDASFVLCSLWYANRDQDAGAECGE